MAKRDKNTITLGSGELFMDEFTGSMPTIEDICVEENLLGRIKGGASLEYSQDTYEEKDDLGYVSKIITTNEEALLKSGLLTWNGHTLKKLIDRCGVTEAGGKRITKIGGAGNAQGTHYVICFRHKDQADGNVYILIKGRNQAGVTIKFASDSGTVIDAEFKALPHDEEGTLIEFIEEIPGAVTHTVTLAKNASFESLEYSHNGTSWYTYTAPVNVVEGAGLYIRAIPAAGKVFTQWATGITTNPFHILNITSNISYTPTATAG